MEREDAYILTDCFCVTGCLLCVRVSWVCGLAGCGVCMHHAKCFWLSMSASALIGPSLTLYVWLQGVLQAPPPLLLGVSCILKDTNSR